MQPHRSNALDGAAAARFDSDTQTRCGSVTALVLVSSASGPRVSGCIRARRARGTFMRTPRILSYFSEFSFFSMPLRLFMDYLNAGAKPPQGTVVHIRTSYSIL